MSGYTRHPLTYNRGEYDGENWLLADVDFGSDEQFCITTDCVHASEFEPGDPEADVRLWAVANQLAYVIGLYLSAHQGHESDAPCICSVCERARRVLDRARGTEGAG